MSISERARHYIAKCPPAISGQGGHNATFRVAAILIRGFSLGEPEALMLLREWNAGCLPPWTEAELIHKVKSAANAEHQNPRGYLVNHGMRGAECGVNRTPLHIGERVVKPAFRPMVLKRIAAKTSAIRDVFGFIAERSPVRVDTEDSVSVLRRLYPSGSGEKVLIFSDMRSQGQMLWEADKGNFIKYQHLPAGSDGVWFLPQPVDGLFHPNPRSERLTPSRRSEESVRVWRYAVLESDKAAPEDCLRCLIQMPLRIASVCESGRRSIHALVRLDAESKADWDNRVKIMKPVLVTLGADPGALSAVRLTRLPQAKRGERVQRLLYLNPLPDSKPIGSEMKGGK